MLRRKWFYLDAATEGGEGGGDSATTTTQSATTSAATTGTATQAAATATKETKNDSYWPEDWRQTVSKADAKVLSRLERYASPAAAMEALIAAQNRISAGELKPVLGKNPSADELKEWREAHGIPDAPDKYDIKDTKLDAKDPSVQAILKAAHDSNQTPEQIKATLKAWNDVVNASLETRSTHDREVTKTSEDTLRAEWGSDYRRNVNLINGLFDGNADQKLKDMVLESRLPDGTPFASSPDVLKMLLSLALIQNPTGIVVPGAGGNQAEGIREELAKIDKVRATNRGVYNKDDKMQERERTLIAAAIQMGAMDENGNWKK